MSIGSINLLLLLAAAQGILLSFLIIHKHRKLFANYFLASLMLLLSVTLIYLLLSELGWYKKYPFLMLIPVGFPFLVNPLFYLYAKYLIQYSSSFKKSDFLHFLPFIVYELFSLPDFFSSSKEIIAIFDTITRQQLHPRFILFNWLIIIQGWYYIALILFMLRNHSYSLEKAFSNIEKMRLNWLRNIIIFVGAVWLVFIIENIMYLADIQYYKIFDLASVFAALLVYSLGYMGLLKSEVFEQPAFIESYKYTKQLKDANLINSQPEKKYEKSGLNEKKAKEYLDHLEKLMKEEKPYLDSNLTLKQLADLIEISTHNLSQIINTKLNQNFFDYINQYRVEEIKRFLEDPQKKNITLLSLGFDAGFNSKSSFNSIFKRYTGLTPSEYQKQIK
jgi:AraC-like DNA-binding protein